MPTARPALDVPQLGLAQIYLDVQLELRAHEHLPALGLDVAIERAIGSREMYRRLHLVADESRSPTAEDRLEDADRALAVAAVDERRAGETRDVRRCLVTLGLLCQELALSRQHKGPSLSDAP